MTSTHGKIRAILFDLDGVLVSTVDLHQTAFIEAVRQVSGLVIEPAYHMRFLNALSTREKIRWLIERGSTKLDALQGRVWEVKQRMTSEMIPQTIRPDTETQSLLGQLRGLNYKVACVSNSIRATTMEMLEAAGLIGYDYFDLIVSNEDVTRQKPAPDPYLETASNLGLNPDQCLAIEDADRGVQSATSAGCHVLQVPGPSDVKFMLVWDTIRNMEGWK